MSELQKPICAPQFRKSFTVNQVREAELYICGLGFYDLYLNGQRLTQGELTPYITQYHKRVYYDVYDLSDKLLVGENVLAVILGNGLYNPAGGYVWDFHNAPWRDAPKLAINLRYSDDNGVAEIRTDDSWRVSDSPIWFDDLWCGEYYDATKEQEGWMYPGFNDSAWDMAQPTGAPAGEWDRSSAQRIEVCGKLYPRQAVPLEDGVWCYDFGESTAGVCELTISGERGQEIKLEYAERVDESFHIADKDLRAFTPEGMSQTDKYILSGNGTEHWCPRFTYHGYRYVIVSGLRDGQQEGLLTALSMYSALPERTRFRCSDPISNQLWEMTRRSALTNFHYYPTDCPHREKNGWTGDASLSAELLIRHVAAEKSLKEWLKSIRDIQKEDGCLPGIVPTGGWGFAWGNGPGWDAVLTQIPYVVYRFTGDKQIIEDNADAIDLYLDYMAGKRDKGLLSYGLPDWCSPKLPAHEPKCPLRVSDTLIGMDICSKAGKLFAAIGQIQRQQKAENLQEELRQSFRETLINGETLCVEGDCQAAQAMALHYGAFDPEEEPRAFALLLEQIHREDDHIDCGVFGCQALFRVLTRFGETALAYRMITRPDYPSFGAWVSAGATTLWEDFEAKASLNHHFYGDFTAWFLDALAGLCVNPCGDNPNEVLLDPHFIQALHEVEAQEQLPGGCIRIFWKRQGKYVRLQVTASPEITIRLSSNLIATAIGKPDAFQHGDFVLWIAECDGGNGNETEEI